METGFSRNLQGRQLNINKAGQLPLSGYTLP